MTTDEKLDLVLKQQSKLFQAVMTLNATIQQLQDRLFQTADDLGGRLRVIERKRKRAI